MRSPRRLRRVKADDPTNCAARLGQALRLLAATLADIARALAGELGDELGSEILFWAEATTTLDRRAGSAISTLTDEPVRESAATAGDA